MENLQLKDVGEIFISAIADPTSVYFLGMNDKIDFTEKLKTSTVLSGGIGDIPQSIIQAGKQADLTVSPLMYSENALGILNGVKMVNGSATLPTWESGINVVGGIATIQGTPAVGTTSVIGFDSKGNQSNGTLAGQTVTFTTNVPTDNTKVTIEYPQLLTGTTMDLDMAKFPQAYAITWHTVSFDPATNVEYSDVYYKFYRGIPDGASNQSFQTAKQVQDPIKFNLFPEFGTTLFGKYISVPKPNVLVSPIVTPQASAVHATVITLTFPDNTTWRDNISDLKVNAISAIGSFTTLPGMIKLAASLTPSAATYTIVIKSTNFPDVTISQITT